MDVTLQYFDGCPNWTTTRDHLSTLEADGLVFTVRLQSITDHEEAAAAGFRGSPTVLIDGVDPFAERRPLVGLACRFYRTEKGVTGSPSLSQLRTALTAASR